MTDPTPPTWVSKRDGRLVPFEADRIHRALFAASESLGGPDAFLARELADGVVHFLAIDSEGQTTTTRRVAEVVVQVVRELGHPDLARAFAEHERARDRRSTLPTRPLAAVLAAAARNYTLQTVYTRDLAAAQEAGLLTLGGLQTPAELAGCVLGPPVAVSGDLVADLEQARRFAGQLVAIDGLEHLAAERSPADLAAATARGLRLTGLNAVVNLNSGTPPSWADPLAEGPLFAAHDRRADAARLRERTDELLAHFLGTTGTFLRIDWHLAAADFSDARRDRLLRVVRLALEGAAIGFVFDRPRRPVALAEGLDRAHPATLLVAGLHLPALARQPGKLSDAERFRTRLGSLVRLALSAAAQKRDFVRQEVRRQATADVTSGFLLDRARFVVVPVGLDEVVNQLTGWGMANGGPSLELGRQLVRRIAEVLRQDGRVAQMDGCLDGPFTFSLEEGAPPGRQDVAGLTPWGPTAGASGQLKAGGGLHAITEQGTLALFVEDATAEEVVAALSQAWRETAVVRLRLVGASHQQGQLFAAPEALP